VQTQVPVPDLATIVESVATMMLGLDLGEPAIDVPDASYTIGASVQLMGDWAGAIVVGCDATFGAEAAGAMFGTDPATVTQEEISDALGELANMIAGNVKPLLPGTATISLPTVVRGEEIHLGIPGAQVWVGLTYRRGETVLMVRVYQRVS